MTYSSSTLISEALADWILSRMEIETDFCREGLPEFDPSHLLQALSKENFPVEYFSIALVGCDKTDIELRTIADEYGLGKLAGISCDLHVATEWRNNRIKHPRIIALACGYNEYVHGLRFFSSFSSSELATCLLKWAKRTNQFKSTPAHLLLLKTLSSKKLLVNWSLEDVARFLALWSERNNTSKDVTRAPCDVLPALGLLRDPDLFEADDLEKRLEQNLEYLERVTIISPRDVRKFRDRAEHYKNQDISNRINEALSRLESYLYGGDNSDLTFKDAKCLIAFPSDKLDPPGKSENDKDEDEAVDIEGSSGMRDLSAEALFNGHKDDLKAINAMILEAWKKLERNGNKLVATQNTSKGLVELNEQVDLHIIEWVTEFCNENRFGGLLECDVGNLEQALTRRSEFKPVFLNPDKIWKHDGVYYSIESLLGEWDKIDAVSEACSRPILEIWRDFIAERQNLGDKVKYLLIHPREWLDTDHETHVICKRYLELSTELYSSIQKHYRAMWDQSREWAQATLDAILALDLVQVRITEPDGRIRSQAIMLPLHPLHLWRQQRLSDLLYNISNRETMLNSDKKAVMQELQRPEHFLGVIRVGATPEGKGLNQLLPLTGTINGLATFENLHNSVSGTDGIETLLFALERYVILYPNHPWPLRLTIVNPPKPARLLEQLTKFLDERRYYLKRISALDVTFVATDGHKDRLTAASTLEGNSQDLVYEKIASGRLNLRINHENFKKLDRLVQDDLMNRPQHIIAIFDESSISVRRRRVDRQMSMSPFCVRNDIVVDKILGTIKLSPHPGEPPFSDFIQMIHEFEQEQRDSTMVASADTDQLHSIIDQILLDDRQTSHWLLLADRALPLEYGMRSIRLLHCKEGQRQVLLIAANYERLSTLLRHEFDNCNLTITSDRIGNVLRQGVNLVGSGLLEMFIGKSGKPDKASFLGFLGMLLAARYVRSEDSDALIASVDVRIARHWLRLGSVESGKRCDLIAIRRCQDGTLRITCIEVKTTGEAFLSKEGDLLKHAADQIEQTAEVIANVFNNKGLFSAPRTEMLKEVLVRAASCRWSTDKNDIEQRKNWGKLLKDLFSDDSKSYSIQVDGEIVLIKLRSTEPSKSIQLSERKFKIAVRTITEKTANELFMNDFTRKAQPENPEFDSDNENSQKVNSQLSNLEVNKCSETQDNNTESGLGVSNRDGIKKSNIDTVNNDSFPVITNIVDFIDNSKDSDTKQSIKPDSFESNCDVDESCEVGLYWPPRVNVLGMVGQYEIAQELNNQARKAKGWNERFLDKLFVGPAGVGKTTLACRIAEQLLQLNPIVFNGADLRRPEMIVDRLVEAGKLPAKPTGSVDVAPCLIFIDEIHAVSNQVSTVLLSALDDRRNTTIVNVVYNFNDVVFFLATTDPGMLSEAFLSRCDKTVLQSYTLEEIAGIVWIHSVDKLGKSGLSRETCIEIAARMQCSPRPSVNILEPLVASFFGTAECTLDRIPTKEEVAKMMNVKAVSQWFQRTQGIDQNGLAPEHIHYLKLLRSRGAVAEEEIRRALGISNRADFVIVSEYLTRLNLIQVGPGGRGLTSDGRRYLTAKSLPDLRDRISRRKS